MKPAEWPRSVLRDRDQLPDLPRIPEVWEAATSGRRVQQRSAEHRGLLRWANGVILVIRALYAGFFPEADVLLEGSSVGSQEWSRATPLQRELSLRILQRLRLRKEIFLGVAAAAARVSPLRRVRGRPDVGYPSSIGGAVTQEPKGTSDEPLRGQVYSGLPAHVARPPAGTVPVPIIELSDEAKFFLEWAAELMIRADGDIDWISYYAMTPYMDEVFRDSEQMMEMCALFWEGGCWATATRLWRRFRSSPSS